MIFFQILSTSSLRKCMEFNMEKLNMDSSQGMEDGGVPKGHFSIVGLKERQEVSIF